MPDLIKDLKSGVLETFQTAIRGRLILRGDADYDESRKVYNAMIDKYPGMIVKCVDVADVIASVHFGRDNRIPIAR